MLCYRDAGNDNIRRPKLALVKKASYMTGNNNIIY